MWLNICQGLLLVGWLMRLCASMLWAANGRKEVEATGFVGVFCAILWAALGAVVLWRSGAMSTILGAP